MSSQSNNSSNSPPDHPGVQFQISALSAKTEIGKISKTILDKINKTVKSKTGSNQWQNTHQALDWFIGLHTPPEGVLG